MYSYGQGMGMSYQPASSILPKYSTGGTGMMGTSTGQHASRPTTAASWAARMPAGAMAGVKPKLTDSRAYGLERDQRAGWGVRPGAMPQMSAVAAARMHGQQGALAQQMASRDPADPRNAALGAYPPPQPARR